jgi:quinoprotein glucose dehydrogenase
VVLPICCTCSVYPSLVLAASPSPFDHTASLTDVVLQGSTRFVSLTIGIAILSAACASNRPVDEPRADEWRAYGRDALGSRFSALADINRENVTRLTVAWTYRTGEPLPTAQRRRSLEVTPIVVGGVMYISTPLGKVIAIDPVTGAEKWKYDAKVDPGIRFGDFTNRGVSSWRDRIFFATTDARLIALDAATGSLVRSFGDSGTVDLRRGLRNAPFEVAEYEVTSPPAIINDLVVIGSAVADNNRTDAATGEVRAYDARTGRLVWSWDPVPQDSSDRAYSTWEGANAHNTGAANAWSVITADPARDLVFVPTSAPSPDYYGGERLGRNDYANSIVALRASTGKVVWHFQTVHHDLWDYDNASPPLLATVKGQPAVIQTTKTGMMFVLNRETGVPVFPVEERPVPASTVPGERSWPTQPFSSLPPLSPHSLNFESPNADCRQLMRGLRNEGIFTPPSLEGTLVIPSNIGGAHWGGLTFDPVRQLAIVPVNRLAAMVQLVPAATANADSMRASRSRIGFEDTRMRGTPYIMRRKILFVPPGVPCTPDPPAALVAIDLKTGTKAWEQPLLPNLGGPIATAGGLVFLGATIDGFVRAFDIETGRELWRAELPGGAKATPMTYRGADGRQYVVIAAGGDGETWKPSDAIVAFALPR